MMAAGISPEASVDPAAQLGAGVLVGASAVIHEGARIGAGSSVGSGSVIHGCVEIGEHSIVEDLVVLGKRPRLRSGSSAVSDEQLGVLVIEDRVTICCAAVVYAGARVASGAIIGDQTQVRERSRVGAGSVVGRGSCVDFGAEVGARVLIQTGVYLTAGTVVEDDVFLGPGVVTANDQTMGRHPREPGCEALRGPVFRRACRIGAGSVVLPGVEIGEEAFVAAGSVVTRNVGSHQLVMGVPAHPVREVGEQERLERWR